MGCELQDAFSTRVQGILHIARGLKEVTAILGGEFATNNNSLSVIDSINLPSPPPLLPSLLEAGINSNSASAISQAYQQRAEQFKQRIQQSIDAACRTAAEFPARPSALAHDLFMKRATSFFADVYLSRLKESREQIIQRAKQVSETTIRATSSNSRTFNQVSASYYNVV